MFCFGGAVGPLPRSPVTVPLPAHHYEKAREKNTVSYFTLPRVSGPLVPFPSPLKSKKRFSRGDGLLCPASFPHRKRLFPALYALSPKQKALEFRQPHRKAKGLPCEQVGKGLLEVFVNTVEANNEELLHLLGKLRYQLAKLCS